MRLAILDFGTNTFNLLIAEKTKNDQVRFMHSSKEPVKLGKGGINTGVLKKDAIERGLQAIENHYKTIDKFQAEKVYAFATSAIRDARNSEDFLDEIMNTYDLYVNIIPGDREAELIYKGVRQACDFKSEKALIIDIGGGSVECIIADKHKTYWIRSFDIGMARIIEKFHPEDPISEETVIEIKKYYQKNLNSLFVAVKKYKPSLLAGASGSFETFYELIKHRLTDKYLKDNTGPGREIILEDFRGLHEILLKSTINERKKMKGMEPVRVEMIVPATIFVNFILEKWKFHKMMVSDYALKEGVIAEILNI